MWEKDVWKSYESIRPDLRSVSRKGAKMPLSNDERGSFRPDFPREADARTAVANLGVLLLGARGVPWVDV